MRELGLKTIYPTKEVKTTLANPEHRKYPYLLKDAMANYGKPEIFNTDQGSQYTSHVHTSFLSENGIQISMDGKGRATDNIAIERFWRTAKYEHIYLSDHKSIKELRAGIDNYPRNRS